jgi:hypothetical protein
VINDLMRRHVLYSAFFSFFLFPFNLSAASEPVKEDELKRVEFKYADAFAWMKDAKPVVKAPPPKEGAPTPTTGSENFSDLTSGDLIIKAMGEFSREQKKSGLGGSADEKEILTLTKDVEIEHVQNKFVLRAQKIKVVRDLKSGQAEMVEAQGKVEVWTPERSGRGESLVYEMRLGAHGEIVKNTYTIEGDRANGGRATLWQNDDVIEAEKFYTDRRLDTFRVMGGPVAVVTLPGQGNTGGPAKPASGGGMLPSFSMSGSGKLRLQADGEINYDNSTGRVRMTRNVTIYQEVAAGQAGWKLSADEVTLSLNLPPPGQPVANSSMFSGSLKNLECAGRVEIKMPGTTLLFDRGNLDMQRNIFLMEMKEAKGDVKIYQKDSPNAPAGSVFVAPKTLNVNMSTGEFSAGGPIRREPFEGDPPTNRPKIAKEKEKEKEKPK